MRIDRKQVPWAVLTLLLTLAAVWIYLANFHPATLPVATPLPAWFGEVPPSRGSIGGSPYGLSLGIAAAVIFLFAAALGVRRRRPTLKIGRLQTWLRAHIWFSLLTVPLIVLHSGFSIGGPMTRVLLLLYAVVMGSGLLGLILQQFIPRLMKERVPLETIFEQIPHIRKQLVEEAEAFRASLNETAEAAPKPKETGEPAEGSEPTTDTEPEEPDESVERLRDFVDRQALPYLRARRGEKFALGDRRVSDDAFRILKIGVDAPWHAEIEALQARCDERRQLDLQTRYHHSLHGWLFVHVPATLLLLLFTAWHAVVTLVYY